MTTKAARKAVISENTFRRELCGNHVFQSRVETEARVQEKRNVSVRYGNAGFDTIILEHVLEQMSELYTTDLYRQLAGISKELRTPIPELSAALAQYLNPNNLSGVKRDRVLKEMFGKT